MTGTAARMQRAAGAVSDEQLIHRCLDGDQQAWAALIDRYKNLIYSIPIKLGMHQDAGDIFQAVCVSWLANLSQLRKERALPKWLIQTSYHECLRHQRAAGRTVGLDSPEIETPVDAKPLAENVVIESEEEQTLRAAVAEMPERCTRLIRMLFFDTPTRPYSEIAQELGLATGSLGFIRGRCLRRLRKYLESKGF
ncbi:MAG TPA: sigma-70 family RNA polymerase sigma factor [Terriglobales bacterium]|jgi:RNA polymerase sigma factor (sigma-70 family)|nr:sigma-70 family RNA polymerase sigma factor [Terriglobales bacterium]